MAALRRKSGHLLAVLLGLLTVGCTSTPKALTPCPSARVLADTSEITRFRNGSGRDLTDIAFEASFLRVTGECRYDKDGGEIKVELAVVLNARNGPSNTDNAARFSYFVALEHAAPGAGSGAPVIVTREAFPVEARFAAGRTGLTYTDILEMSIPRPDAQDVRNYRLYLGFELTPDELDFNRRK